MKRQGAYGVILAATLLMFSCDDQVDWDLKYQELDLVVVDGKISSEAKAHEVRLSKPFYEMNGAPDPVSGAQVEINDGRQLHTLTEDSERPGVYLTDSLFAALPDQFYQLRILSGTKRITAVSIMAKVTPIQYMNVYRVQDDPPLLEVYINDSDEPAILRLDLDWSHVPGYEALPDSANHAVIYHYTMNGVDVNKIFKPGQEHVRFPPGTIVFREKESVNGWYGEFLRGVLSETDWRGGMFDVLPGNARTNMEGEGIGFFTVAEVIRDTIVVR
jgi:hypothetical protein